jgi:TP901 family phage tail tape measure protein
MVVSSSDFVVNFTTNTAQIDSAFAKIDKLAQNLEKRKTPNAIISQSRQQLSNARDAQKVLEDQVVGTSKLLKVNKELNALNATKTANKAGKESMGLIGNKDWRVSDIQMQIKNLGDLRLAYKNLPKDMNNYTQARARMAQQIRTAEKQFQDPIAKTPRSNLSAIQQEAKAWNEMLAQRPEALKRIAELNKQLTPDLKKNDPGLYKKIGDQVNYLSNQFGAGAPKVGLFQKSLNLLSSDIMKVGYWMIAIQSVFKLIAVFTEGAKAIGEVDKAVFALQKVMRGSSSSIATDIDKMRKAAVLQGQETGSAMSDVLLSYRDFIQQGKSVSDAVALTNAAMMAVNIAELTVADSTHLLTAAVHEFNLPAIKATSVLNSWNEISNTVGGTTKDLAESVSKAGATFAMYGGTIDELNALTTAMVRTTARSGSEVGTALRMMSVNYGNLSKKKSVDLALSQVGLRAWDEQKQQYNSMFDVMGKLAGQWDTLNPKLQENIARTISGARHITYFYAAMKNWDLVMSALVSSIGSVNSAQRENDIYMRSLKGRTDQLNTAWKNLFSEGAGGILEVFKGLITLTNYLVIGMGSMGGQAVMLVGIFAGLTPIVWGLWTALIALEAITPFGWLAIAVGAIATITTGVGAVTNAMEEANRARKRELVTTAEQVSSMEAMINTGTSVIDFYKRLQAHAGKSTEDYKRFKDETEKLTKILGFEAVEELKNMTDVETYRKAFVDRIKSLGKEAVSNRIEALNQEYSAVEKTLDKEFALYETQILKLSGLKSLQGIDKDITSNISQNLIAGPKGANPEKSIEIVNAEITKFQKNIDNIKAKPFYVLSPSSIRENKNAIKLLENFRTTIEGLLNIQREMSGLESPVSGSAPAGLSPEELDDILNKIKNIQERIDGIAEKARNIIEIQRLQLEYGTKTEEQLIAEIFNYDKIIDKKTEELSRGANVLSMTEDQAEAEEDRLKKLEKEIDSWDEKRKIAYEFYESLKKKREEDADLWKKLFDEEKKEFEDLQKDFAELTVGAAFGEGLDFSSFSKRIKQAALDGFIEALEAQELINAIRDLTSNIGKALGSSLANIFNMLSGGQSKANFNMPSLSGGTPTTPTFGVGSLSLGSSTVGGASTVSTGLEAIGSSVATLGLSLLATNLPAILDGILSDWGGFEKRAKAIQENIETGDLGGEYQTAYDQYEKQYKQGKLQLQPGDNNQYDAWMRIQRAFEDATREAAGLPPILYDWVGGIPRLRETADAATLSILNMTKALAATELEINNRESRQSFFKEHNIPFEGSDIQDLTDDMDKYNIVLKNLGSNTSFNTQKVRDLIAAGKGGEAYDYLISMEQQLIDAGMSAEDAGEVIDRLIEDLGLGLDEAARAAEALKVAFQATLTFEQQLMAYSSQMWALGTNPSDKAKAERALVDAKAAVGRVIQMGPSQLEGVAESVADVYKITGHRTPGNQGYSWKDFYDVMMNVMNQDYGSVINIMDAIQGSIVGVAQATNNLNAINAQLAEEAKQKNYQAILDSFKSKMGVYDLELQKHTTLYDTLAERLAFFNSLMGEFGRKLNAEDLKDITDNLAILNAPFTTLEDKLSGLDYILSMMPEGIDRVNYEMEALKQMIATYEGIIDEGIIKDLKARLWKVEFTQNNTIDVVVNMNTLGDWDALVKRITNQMQKAGKAWSF